MNPSGTVLLLRQAELSIGESTSSCVICIASIGCRSATSVYDASVNFEFIVFSKTLVIVPHVIRGGGGGLYVIGYL